MANGTQPFRSYRIAAFVVLVAFWAARAMTSDRAAIVVAGIGIPLIFIYGNYRNPDPDPWWQVAAGIGLVVAFFALLMAGFLLLDDVFTRWALVGANAAWAGVLLGTFLYALWRLNRPKGTDV